MLFREKPSVGVQRLGAALLAWGRSKKVSTDIDAMAFNTAISALMVFASHLARLPATPREPVRVLVLLVSPFAPQVAEELWRHLGHAASLAHEP